MEVVWFLNYCVEEGCYLLVLFVLKCYMRSKYIVVVLIF